MLIIQKSSGMHWTLHAKAKMHFYGISEQRVKRILHTPKRVEEGIAPDTIAVMQPAGSAKHPHELWVMMAQNSKMDNTTQPSPGVTAGTARDMGKTRPVKYGVAVPPRAEFHGVKIISVWRYPGTTKPGEPLPQAVLRGLLGSLL